MSDIVFFEIEGWEEEYLQEYFKGAVVFSEKKAQDEITSEISKASIISTFIYSNLDKETLGKFPNLKLIATRSTGYDHIALDYCKEKGIVVVNVPSYGAHAVAEHTFALILALSRKLIPTIEQSRRGNFSLVGLAGFDLAGKTIGVIGTGKIGSKVVKLARAFEMEVLIFTKHPEEFYGQANVTTATLEEILPRSDIVTLHLPYTKETHHIINRENMMSFKKGSVLINTSRGQLIETQAILEGLEKGILQGAGLDVLEEEGGLKEERELLSEDYLQHGDLKTQLLNHVLLNRDDVLFTSHNAFHSQESVRKILDITAANIHAFKKGEVQNTIS